MAARTETLEGLRALKARLSKARVNGALRGATNRGGRLFRAEVVVRAPKDRGDLRRAIGVRFENGGSSGIFRATVQARGLSKPYDVWTERGTGVYIGRGMIRPTKAKMMRFYWKKMGRVVYFLAVKGQPGQFYFKRAYNDTKSAVIAIYNEEIRKL